MPNTSSPSAYGPILPTTISKADDVLNAAAKAGRRVPMVYGWNTTPDHNNKKCIDFMHYTDTVLRDWLVAYLRANAKRLGVVGIISNRRVMGFPSNGPAYRGPEGQWRTYTGPNPHTDHVHVEFNTAAIKRTIIKPRPPKPMPTPARPNFEAAAAALRRAMKANKPGTPANVAATKALAAIKGFVK